MSKDLSFREQLAQPVAKLENGQAQSGFPAELSIETKGAFAHPVALAKLLTRNGVSLAEAHDLIGKLACDRKIHVAIATDDLARLISQIEAFGLTVGSRSPAKVLAG